jgi:hypothetical protein
MTTTYADFVELYSGTGVVASVTGGSYRTAGQNGFTLQAVVTPTGTSAKTFVDGDVTVGSDLIAITAHGFTNGQKVAATSSGTLPAGLSATNYFIVYVTANSVKLATSYANAIAGTVVDITAAAGGGTHTLTPASFSHALKWQGSIDNINFIDIASSSQTATDGTGLYWNYDGVYYNYIRPIITVTSGVGAGTYSLMISYRPQVSMR